ncbi:MAG: helix-turn-helix domain-containing protein [Rubrivivax sp.]
MATTLDSTGASDTVAPPPALQAALDRLRELRVIPRAGAALDKDAGEVTLRLGAAVLAEVPAFSESRNPDVLPGLQRHAGEHVAELRRLFGGGPVRPFDFVRAHARQRAAQRFPLEATLQAYRCALQTVLPWLQAAALTAAQSAQMPAEKAARKATGKAAQKTTQKTPQETASEAHAQPPGSPPHVAQAVADFADEYMAIAGIVAAAEYVAHTRALAEAEGDRRTELLGILVSGYDEADARVARLLKRAGYLEQRLSFCVAVAQSTDPLEMESPARALRIVQAMTEAVAAMPVRALVGVRGNTVVAVYSDLRRTSGWTAPQASLAKRLRPHLLALGPAVLIGLSADQPSTSFIPRALHEATVALDFASVGERLVSFTALPIRRLLVHRGAGYVQSALPAWYAALREADRKSGGSLVKTLRALADADMNVQRAAREIGVHANTLYARLVRIADLTGLDAQRYHDLTQLLLAADCAPA